MPELNFSLFYFSLDPMNPLYGTTMYLVSMLELCLMHNNNHRHNNGALVLDDEDLSEIDRILTFMLTTGAGVVYIPQFYLNTGRKFSASKPDPETPCKYGNGRCSRVQGVQNKPNAQRRLNF